MCCDNYVYWSRDIGRKLSLACIWRVVFQLCVFFLKSTCSLSFSPFMHMHNALIKMFT